MRQLVFALMLVAGGSLIACQHSPAGPTSAVISGRWTGGGACLSVTDAMCTLVVGCGHGQFPPPLIRADGGFDVDGTYRIEVGPISIDPPPSAHFSGSFTGSRLILNVMPSGTLSPASYSMTPASPGICSVLCV